jgi:Cys-tRNA(Pro)/Cys-tRNA(Cys) deacylase
MAETRGTTRLRAAGIEHGLHRYRYQAGGGAAEQAAEALGIEPARMFKSLVVRAGEAEVFALVPAGHELSLKNLAAAAGVRSAKMAEPRDAERLTGYQVGGISPLGSRRALPVYLDRTALDHEQICLNAGGRGLIVELRTADLVEAIGAVPAELTAQII